MSRCTLNTYLQTMCLKLSALYKHYIHKTCIFDRNKGCGREVNSQIKEKSRDLLILPHISKMAAFSETDSLSVTIKKGARLFGGICK